MMSLLDSLYCEEKHQWEDDEEEPVLGSYSCVDNHPQHTLLGHDLYWEDQELSSLISKESDECFDNNRHTTPSANHRREAVEWMLGVVSHYSFTALTAVLAVNYLDRFFDRFGGLESEKKQQQQPWMTQLAAVSCLSLAAKVEETHVPLLLDLQMEGSKYVFEAKTIQKMEILILSTLEWKMNPVTPLSFLDYITRRLGLKSYLSSEFLKRCECLLLCFLPDRSTRAPVKQGKRDEVQGGPSRPTTLCGFTLRIHCRAIVTTRGLLRWPPWLFFFLPFVLQTMLNQDLFNQIPKRDIVPNVKSYKSKMYELCRKSLMWDVFGKHHEQNRG